jgi:hypothetical protein
MVIKLPYGAHCSYRADNPVALLLDSNPDTLPRSKITLRLGLRRPSVPLIVNMLHFHHQSLLYVGRPISRQERLE